FVPCFRRVMNLTTWASGWCARNANGYFRGSRSETDVLLTKLVYGDGLFGCRGTGAGRCPHPKGAYPWNPKRDFDLPYLDGPWKQVPFDRLCYEIRKW